MEREGFLRLKPVSLLGKLIVVLAIAAAIGVIVFIVYTLVLRTEYKETALEINDMILVSGNQAKVSQGEVTLAATPELADYYNQFLLFNKTLVYNRKSTQKTDETIILEFGENRLSFTGLEDGTAIGVCWETPAKQKEYRVRSQITFMQLEAYFNNYARKALKTTG